MHGAHNTCECMNTLRKNAYGLVHARLCNGAEAPFPWKLLRIYLESCGSIVQAVVCRPLLPPFLLSRPNPLPDAVRSRNPSKSTLAHDAAAAAVLHKHHSIIRVGAGLIQFVYGSHWHLATEVTSSRIPFWPFFRMSFKSNSKQNMVVMARASNPISLPSAMALSSPSHRDTTTPSPCWAPHFMTQEHFMFSNPTSREPRPSLCVTMSDDMLLALTLPLHCAFVLHPATHPQVVAFKSWTISAPICLNRFSLTNHGNPIFEPVCVFYLFIFCLFFLIETNFSFKSLLGIWLLSPQRFHYYFYLGIFFLGSIRNVQPFWYLCCTFCVYCRWFAHLTQALPRLHLSSAADDKKIVSCLQVRLSPLTSSCQPLMSHVFADSRIALLCHALHIWVAHAPPESCPSFLLVHCTFRACSRNCLPLLHHSSLPQI